MLYFMKNVDVLFLQTEIWRSVFCDLEGIKYKKINSNKSKNDPILKENIYFTLFFLHFKSFFLLLILFNYSLI